MTHNPSTNKTVHDEVHDPVNEDVGLSEQDKADLKRLIDEGNNYLKIGDDADVGVGRCAKAIFDRKLHRPETRDEFCQTEFGRSYETIRGYIKLAEHQEECEAKGVEPLTCRAHVLAVDPLPSIDDKVRAVKRAREFAKAEDKKLNQTHLKQAREEIEDELIGEAETSEDPLSEVKDEVRARGGIHVVLPENALPEGVVGEIKQSYLPGRIIAPYDELPAGQSGAADQRTCDDKTGEERRPEKLTRADLDEVAEFVWFVLARDPWEPASAWDVPDGDFRATYHPDRLIVPSTPVETGKKREADNRSATVLVAPGVDILHPDVPEPVREAVVAATGEDLERRYLFLTEHPQVAAEIEWAANAVVCVTASDAASVKRMAGIAAGAGVRFALVLRDAEGELPAEALKHFSWVLIRGKKTSQASYDSVFRAVPYDRIQVGRKVHARPLGYTSVVEPPIKDDLVQDDPVQDDPAQDDPSQNAVHEESTTPHEQAAPARDPRPVLAKDGANGRGKSSQKSSKHSSRHCSRKKRPTRVHGSTEGESDDRPFANLTPVGHAPSSLRATG